MDFVLSFILEVKMACINYIKYEILNDVILQKHRKQLFTSQSQRLLGRGLRDERQGPTQPSRGQSEIPSLRPSLRAFILRQERYAGFLRYV